MQVANGGDWRAEGGVGDERVREEDAEFVSKIQTSVTVAIAIEASKDHRSH